jgi:hypothetical protein
VAGVARIAILDDYIGVALEYGDWSALPDDAEITVYRESIPPERLVDELSDYEIVVITQQRARFPRQVMAWRDPSDASAYCTGFAATSAPPSAGGWSTLKVCAPVRMSTSVTPTSVPCALKSAWALARSSATA